METAFRICFRWAVALSMGAMLAPSVLATESAEYAALRAARISSDAFKLENVELVRDAFTFNFDDGVLYLGVPIAGEPVYGVFVGTGRLHFAPKQPVERHHLSFRLGDPAKTDVIDVFKSLVIMATDDTFEELRASSKPSSGAQQSSAARAMGKYLDWQRDKLSYNYQIRLLDEVLSRGENARESFIAHHNGGTIPNSMIRVEGKGYDDVDRASLIVDHPSKWGTWYLSGRPEGLREERKVRARHYDVRSRIAKNADLSGTTTMHFSALRENLRVVPISLMPKLRISTATMLRDGQQIPLDFIQESDHKDGQAAIIFPEPLPLEKETVVRVEYSGEDVLINDGDGNYFVTSRASWYSNVDRLNDYTTYDLQFEVPENREVVAIGDRVSNEANGNTRTSIWKVDTPVKVAGFNYGEFRMLERRDDATGIKIEVFTNPGIPDWLAMYNSSVSERVGPGATPGLFNTGNALGAISTESLAEDVMADGMNAARVFTTMFGEAPFKRIAITQQSVANFGQAWPSLIFLPYVSFLDGTERAALGMGRGTTDFVDEVGIHEMAHQWWGHLVGWEDYRDQWLSEGMAEFSTALALEMIQGKEGNAWYREFWRKSQERIIERPRGATSAPYKVGPISLGTRLATERSPSAYAIVVYSKGAFVLHMLRMMMQENTGKDRDARFVAMMKDFAQSHRSQNVTTDDFQAVVEKHITPELNATGDGSVDWFFDQWVHGSHLPSHESDLRVEKVGGKEYRIVGTISQSGVPEDFLTLVPLYVDLGKGRVGRIARAPFKGEMSRNIDMKISLPSPPKRALINYNYENLSTTFPDKKSRKGRR